MRSVARAIGETLTAGQTCQSAYYSAGSDFPDSVVPRVRHIEITALINRNTSCLIEPGGVARTVCAASIGGGASYSAHHCSRRNLSDSVGIRNMDDAPAIYCHLPWLCKANSRTGTIHR